MIELSPDEMRGGIHPVALAAILDGTAQDRIVATAGLTPEQVEAIPRLIAWYQGKPSDFERHDAWMAEWRELDRIFKTGGES